MSECTRLQVCRSVCAAVRILFTLSSSSACALHGHSVSSSIHTSCPEPAIDADRSSLNKQPNIDLNAPTALSSVVLGAALNHSGTIVVTVSYREDYFSEGRRDPFVRSVIVAESTYLGSNSHQTLWETTSEKLFIGPPSFGTTSRSQNIFVPYRSDFQIVDNITSLTRSGYLELSYTSGEVVKDCKISEFSGGEDIAAVWPSPVGELVFGSSGLVCIYTTESCARSVCIQTSPSGPIEKSFEDSAETRGEISHTYASLDAKFVSDVNEFGVRYASEKYYAATFAASPTSYSAQGCVITWGGTEIREFTSPLSEMNLVRTVSVPTGDGHFWERFVGTGVCGGPILAIDRYGPAQIYHGSRWQEMR
jgi:hypothetical protein